MSAGSAFVQLEEVDERLRGKRILTYLPSVAKEALHYIRLMVNNVQAGDSPFARIICITGSSLYRTYADGIGATLIVGPRDNTDWSLVLTACGAHPNTLIVIFPDCRAPDALLGRLPAASTLIQFRGLEEVGTNRLYGLYFFPHVADMAGTDADLVIKRATELIHGPPDLRSILKELRLAGAGLVILGQTMALNWWDAREEMPPLRRRADVNAALLHFLADTIN